MKWKSKELKKAHEEHDEWLRKRGIKKRPRRSKRRGLRSNIEKDPGYRSPELPSTSDRIIGTVATPVQDRRDASLRAAIASKASTVAPSFNKGPLQPQTSRDLFDSQRRS